MVRSNVCVVGSLGLVLLCDLITYTVSFKVVTFGVKFNGPGLRAPRIHSNRGTCAASVAMNFVEPADSSESETTSSKSPSTVSLLRNLISDSSHEDAARRRAQAAREALRRAQLVGEAIPPHWARGQQYHDGDRNAQFGPGELVIFKERFAVVQMYDEQGMLVVEAANGDAPGSRRMRHLGTTVLGKITAAGHLELAEA